MLAKWGLAEYLVALGERQQAAELFDEIPDPKVAGTVATIRSRLERMEETLVDSLFFALYKERLTAAE
ncbi:MAG: hypothetical protein QGI83_01690 [Candidatus Latescibacteria bacterium]|nr:hypothetical protein [Candidatus Latescibacterota bacterium]